MTQQNMRMRHMHISMERTNHVCRDFIAFSSSALYESTIACFRCTVNSGIPVPIVFIVFVLIVRFWDRFLNVGESGGSQFQEDRSSVKKSCIFLAKPVGGYYHGKVTQNVEVYA